MRSNRRKKKIRISHRAVCARFPYQVRPLPHQPSIPWAKEYFFILRTRGLLKMGFPPTFKSMSLVLGFRRLYVLFGELIVIQDLLVIIQYDFQFWVDKFVWVARAQHRGECLTTSSSINQLIKSKITDFCSSIPATPTG